MGPSRRESNNVRTSIGYRTVRGLECRDGTVVEMSAAYADRSTFVETDERVAARAPVHLALRDERG